MLLGVGLYFAIQLPSVQTWLTQRVASYLSGELGAKVTVGGVEIDLWARLKIKDLYIEDQYQDTLAFIPSLSMRNYSIDQLTGKVSINVAELERPYINIIRHEGDSVLNHKFIVDYINKDADTSSHTLVFMNSLKIVDGSFKYTNENRLVSEDYGIDWNHLDVRNLNVEFNALAMISDSIHANIKGLSLVEKSGFTVENMNTELLMAGGNTRMIGSDAKTEYSALQGDLTFLFSSLDDFDDFEHRVPMNHHFEKASIQMNELAYFSSSLKGYDKVIDLTGNIRGTVANLKGRNINITLDENTSFHGNFDMEGLPEINETFITLDIKSLSTNKKELDKIQLPPYDSLHYLTTPENFAELGQITYKGNFTGFINDFVSYGKITTAIGSISTDLSLKEDPAIKDYRYTGNLALQNFHLGKFYSSSTLGPLSFDVAVEGHGLGISKVDATFKGDISELYLNGYNYTGITADGTFKLKSFSGNFVVSDPNVSVDFVGAIDFSKKNPILQFDSQIAHLNLKAIHILEKYDYSSVSGSVSIKSEGLDFNQFQGEIILDDMTYCALDRDYALNHLELTSIRGSSPVITLDSDIAYAEVKGQFDIYEIGNSFIEIASKIIPSFNPPLDKHQTQNFEMDIKIYDFKQISEVFMPDLYIADNTLIKINIDEPRSYFEAQIVSDEIRYRENKIESLTLDLRRPDESFYLSAICDRLVTEMNLTFDDFALDARTEKDTVYTSFAWGNPTTDHSGDINGALTLRNYNSMDFTFGRSKVIVKNEFWTFESLSKISLDSANVYVTNFEITNDNQLLHAEGSITPNPDDKLELDIRNFDLSNVNPFIGETTKFYGTVNGTASIRDIYHDLIFTSNLQLDKLRINDYEIGNLGLTSSWDQTLHQLRIDGKLEKDSDGANSLARYTPLSFAGYYRPRNEKSPLDLTATIKDLDLSFINAFMSPGIIDLNGFASGTMSITGTPEAPQLEADALLKDASVFVHYLNTKYYVEERIGVYPDMFTFDHIRIKDQEGNKGFLTGQMLHDNFAKWNFDIVIEMEDPMLALNTTEELNSLYYGKAYTTGTVNIYGYDSNLEFDISLRSEKGTTLAMPMGTSSEQTFENFVQFINVGDTLKEEVFNLSGIKLKMNFEITPDAEFQIIFDQSVGDVMKGVGAGNISMEINNLSTFTMYGQVEVLKGSYLFTLKNLINKEFIIKPGGTISWFGDPFQADLNIRAIYKVTASLYDLIPDPSYQSGQRIPINLAMNLTGKMFNPGIDFGIELPTVDQVTRSRVDAIISTEQERNRQAFALLVMRRFVSPPNVAAEHNSTNAFAANGTELLSNQISNWLSQISDDFNLGFNYRPGDDISNEEIALALSTQLFNERLSLNSNVGVSRNNGASNNQSTSNLIGDIRIEYKITKEGKIRVVMYNESNDFRIANTQQSPYTQGVGVIYREDFDTFSDLVDDFKKLLKGKEKVVER